MCLNWIEMPDGNVRPCHLCWQCKRDRISDWVGRCIAESETSASTLRLTLTYGRDDHYRVDHPRSQMFHYTDVQAYLKRLRGMTNGKIRFFCTGEYGSQKGRVHWHLILFFKGFLPPEIRMEERYIHSPAGRMLWPHGWSFWEVADPEKMRYAVKYILKDEYGSFERLHRFSSRPEIGHEYFRLEAGRAVAQMVPPRIVYRFPNDWDRFGRPREYRLTRAALYRHLEHYAAFWLHSFGNEDWPQSEIMDAFVDERARRVRRRLGTADWDEVDFVRRFEMERSQWHTVSTDRGLYPSNPEAYRNASQGE